MVGHDREGRPGSSPLHWDSEKPDTVPAVGTITSSRCRIPHELRERTSGARVAATRPVEQVGRRAATDADKVTGRIVAARDLDSASFVCGRRTPWTCRCRSLSPPPRFQVYGGVVHERTASLPVALGRESSGRQTGGNGFGDACRRPSLAGSTPALIASVSSAAFGRAGRPKQTCVRLVRGPGGLVDPPARN